MKASLRDSYDLIETFRFVVDEAQTEYDALNNRWIDFECVGRVEASDEPEIEVGRKVSLRFAPDYLGTVTPSVQDAVPHDDYVYVHAPLNPEAIPQFLEMLRYSRQIGAELYAEILAPPPIEPEKAGHAWTLQDVKFGLRNLVGDAP